MFFSFCLWQVNQKFQLKSKVNTCHIFACGWNICSSYMSYKSYYYVSEHLPIKWEDQRRPENHLWHLPADLYCLMEELWVNCLGMAAAVAPSPDTDSMAAWHGTTNILWRRLVLRWSMVWVGLVGLAIVGSSSTLPWHGSSSLGTSTFSSLTSLTSWDGRGGCLVGRLNEGWKKWTRIKVRTWLKGGKKWAEKQGRGSRS